MNNYNLGKIDFDHRYQRRIALRLQHHRRSRSATCRLLVRYSRGGRKRTQSDARGRRLGETDQAAFGALIAAPP